jgi:uncharacterized protein (TIGR00255 family)
MESMTGFGQGVYQSDTFQIVCLAKSVNHRFLEVYIKLPKRYALLEDRIRREVSERFGRGRVEVQIKYYGFAKGLKEIHLDLELAKKLKTALEILQSELAFEEPLTFQDFLYFRDYLTLEEREEDVEVLWEEVFPALDSALKNLKESRIKEGERLKERILSYFHELKEIIDKISALKEDVKRENIEKAKARIESYFFELTSGKLDPARLYQEVAILLDRLDITEEVDRLKVHLTHFEETLGEPNSGKKLDFLLQEMHREITTLSNKAQNAHLSLLAVSAKDLLEKIREQVQNLV